jgi:putative mRNA 3-end processing factor
VIIFPPHLQRSKAIAKLKGVRTCVASGRVLDGQDVSLDATFVFSGHADHPALLRYARESGARKIYLTGPTAQPLAAELNAAGFAATPLQLSEQMALFGPEGPPTSS